MVVGVVKIDGADVGCVTGDAGDAGDAGDEGIGDGDEGDAIVPDAIGGVSSNFLHIPYPHSSRDHSHLVGSQSAEVIEE